MTPTPEPAVGQMYELSPSGSGAVIAISSLRDDGYWSAFPEMDGSHPNFYPPEDLADATYFGTLDELRELPALKRDAELWRTQVLTDNSVVIANLEAENAKLRAALKSMVEIADSSLLLSHPLRPLVKSAQALLTPTPHE